MIVDVDGKPIKALGCCHGSPKSEEAYFIQINPDP